MIRSHAYHLSFFLQDLVHYSSNFLLLKYPQLSISGYSFLQSIGEFLEFIL